MKLHPIYAKLLETTVKLTETNAKPAYSTASALERSEHSEYMELSASGDYSSSAEARAIQSIVKMNDETNNKLIADIQRETDQLELVIEQLREQESELRRQEADLMINVCLGEKIYGNEEKIVLEREIAVLQKSLSSCADGRRLALAQRLAHIKGELIRTPVGESNEMLDHFSEEEVSGQCHLLGEEAQATAARELNKAVHFAEILCEKSYSEHARTLGPELLDCECELRVNGGIFTIEGRCFEIHAVCGI